MDFKRLILIILLIIVAKSVSADVAVKDYQSVIENHTAAEVSTLMRQAVETYKDARITFSQKSKNIFHHCSNST